MKRNARSLARCTASAIVLASSFLAASAAAKDPPAPAPEVAPPAGPPTLARVIALARERAPNVAAAREDVAVGRSEQVGARLAPIGNPYTELTVNRGTMGATKDLSLQAAFWIPVEVSGQRGTRIAEADALLALREADLETARAAAVSAAVRAYGSAAVAGARVRAWEQIVGTARDEANIYAARLAAGDATERDTKIARVELAKQSITLAEARADLVRALSDLWRLTGERWGGPPPGVDPPDRGRAALADNKGQAAAGPRPPAVRALENEADYQQRVRDRQAREAHAPMSVMLIVGRGDFGEARFGGGLAWTLPTFRRGQGEIARADAARGRALALREVTARNIAAAVVGLSAERDQVRLAIEEITSVAEPAARAAIDAAVATQRAGKGDLLGVLTARRDFALLEARRLDLLQREWSIVGDVVALTGELP